MLITRLATSFVLISGFLAALFFLPDAYWAILTLAIIGLALAEWAALVKFNTAGQYSYVLITVLLFGGLILAELPGLEVLQSQVIFYGILAGAIFWLVLAPIWLITRYRISNKLLLAITGWMVLIPTWLSLLLLKSASFLALVDLQGASVWLLLAVMITVWIADSAAYFVGKRFGRHKLAPQISPGKTWEGAIGAWFVVGLYGIGLCLYFGISFWLVLALWGITLFSIIGDLFESLIKRHSDAKDSGSILPGHGGVLDRIDGLTSSLPLVAFFVYFPLYFQAWTILVGAE
ncbi:phosphatidate cytidylyltransferase [Methylophilaceae bacterium]|nr:phosphatidate cytidylyltransferase [Methylophilaceae bacterium]